jgi:glycosyltransferase involved in cell wall biosynthesis
MPSRPRVLMVARPPLAGVGFPRLAEAMAGEVDLVVTMPARSGTAQRLADSGVEVVDLPDLKGSRLVTWLTRLARSRARQVVHTQTLAAAVPGATAARVLGIPSVWHVREIVGNPLPGRALPATAPATLRRLSATLPSLVMASSAVALAALPGARFGRVVADPVPDLRFVPHDAAEPVRRIGIGGRVARQHGQDVFVEAFGRAFRDRPEVTGLLLGRPTSPESRFSARLRSAASAWDVADRIVHAGRVPDMTALLPTLDVLVHASRPPGGFRAIVVEAMQAGVPVVVTSGTGAAEAVDDEVSGLVVPPEDVGALEFALARLEADPGLRSSVAAGGRRRAADFLPRHGVDAVLNGYLEVLGR